MQSVKMSIQSSIAKKLIILSSYSVETNYLALNPKHPECLNKPCLKLQIRLQHTCNSLL